ncbi:hypothetical protein ACF3NT_01485 [Naumannella halotolerans]|nr:hypothetical protein [Naumannella halotolerans]
MGLFRRRRPVDNRSRAERRAETEAAKAHLQAFAASRIGVEAFLEPATVLDRLSLLLVAGDGESTRRPVPDEAWARKWAASASVPYFNAEVSGYPQRLREYNRRQKLRPEG